MTRVSPAAMGSKRMNPTASAATPTVAAAPATAASTATLSGECRDVRHHAERANRNARSQIPIVFFFMARSPIEVPKPLLLAMLASRLN
jgi:hypothetical protein